MRLAPGLVLDLLAERFSGGTPLGNQLLSLTPRVRELLAMLREQAGRLFVSLGGLVERGLDALLPRLDGSENRLPGVLPEDQEQPGEDDQRPGAEARVDREQVRPAPTAALGPHRARQSDGEGERPSEDSTRSHHLLPWFAVDGLRPGRPGRRPTTGT